MNSAVVSHACVEIPADCLHLLTELVTKIGGRLVKLSPSTEEIFVVAPTHERERIGKMLLGARLRADMTQKALAAAIGVPQSHISEYEKNKRPIPRPKAEELARVLKTVPTHFLPKAEE